MNFEKVGPGGSTFRLIVTTLICSLLTFPSPVHSEDLITLASFVEEAKKHTGKTGVYILDQGEQALLSRAWLAERAEKSIEVQYFIWSNDNIGILATDALLQAAKRGVRVRVIVDDLLIDAPDKTLLALAKHPLIEIRVYNPKHKVGTPMHKRIINMLADFKGFNQRMHDKTFIVDAAVVITGGRNMADEYFDYNQNYNFRDREVFFLGNAVAEASASFERFWLSPLSVPVEDLFDGLGIMQKSISVDDIEVQAIYEELHDYARLEENFRPEVRDAIKQLSERFPELVNAIKWTDVEFISDLPGKNDSIISLRGGGRSTTRLAEMLKQAQHDVVIQTPYLVLTKEAEVLFRELTARGVRIRVSTNSMASTDNNQAFSGYLNQKKRLLKMGMEIYEYKPQPAVVTQLIQRYPEIAANSPVFAIHAKTMVIDGKTVFIGTFNLDPRSINLNTEVGVIIDHPEIASEVEDIIEEDMSAANSWNARTDDPNQYSSFAKRSEVFFWRLMPIKPLL